MQIVFFLVLRLISSDDFRGTVDNLLQKKCALSSGKLLMRVVMISDSSHVKQQIKKMSCIMRNSSFCRDIVGLKM